MTQITSKLLFNMATLLLVVLGHAVVLITLQQFDQNHSEPEKVDMLQAELIPPSNVSKPRPPEPKKEVPKPPEKSAPPPPKILAIAPEKAKPLSTPTPEPVKETPQSKSISEPTPEANASVQDSKIASPVTKAIQTQGNNEVGVEGGSIKLSQLKMIYKPDTNVFYPRISKDIGEQGTVGVVLYIDETGSVSRTQIIRSSGFKRLDKAAEELCSRIRFNPYLVDGHPTSVSAGISIKFEMNR